MMYDIGLNAQVDELRLGKAFRKNRVHKTVKVLGCAIQADFVAQCIIISWRVGPGKH